MISNCSPSLHACSPLSVPNLSTRRATSPVCSYGHVHCAMTAEATRAIISTIASNEERIATVGIRSLRSEARRLGGTTANTPQPHAPTYDGHSVSDDFTRCVERARSAE